MLARMGAALDLEPNAPISQMVETLKELVNARDALVKDRVTALNRKGVAVSDLIKRQLAQRLRQIDSQIDSHRKAPQNAAHNRRRGERALRHLDEHSKLRRGDRERARGRDARTRASRPPTSRKPGRPRSGRQRQRTDPGKTIDPRRARTSQESPSTWPPSTPSGSIPSLSPNTKP